MKPLLLIIAMPFLWSCSGGNIPIRIDSPQQPITMVRLRHMPVFPNESQAQLEEGILWFAAQLGAEVPENALSAINFVDTDTFELDLRGLGFSNEAMEAWQPILQQIVNSNEYSQTGALDVGRFVMLSWGSSWHYYTLTGVPGSLAEYEAAFGGLGPRRFGVGTSCISLGNRLLGYNPTLELDAWSFRADEGTGSLADNSFVLQDIEVFDIMDNGFARYGIYDANGNLKTAASPELSGAGKPARCAWCHEGNLVPILCETQGVGDGIDAMTFLGDTAVMQARLDTYRGERNTAIDFSALQDHTKAELLYVTFMEPSLERIAAEWGISVAEVQQRLAGLTTHQNQEYPDFPPVYYRAEVDVLSPHAVLQVPESAREFSFFEPDFIP